MTKEQAYDDKINPLMAQIIAVCKEHGIAMFATFDLDPDEDGGACCTTCLPDETGAFPERIKRTQDAAAWEPTFTAFTITRKD